MRLTEVINTYLGVHEKLDFYLPTKKRELNKLFSNLSELTQYLIFDIDKDKDFVYPGTQVHPKDLYSINNIYKEMEKNLYNSKKLDKDKMGDLLVDLDTKLKSLQWYIEDARSSIASILEEIDV